MSDTQSQTPQPRALHHGAEQLAAVEDLLLICCKALGRVARDDTDPPGFIKQNHSLRIAQPSRLNL